MLLAAIAIGVVIVALLWDLLLPPAREAFERFRARRARKRANASLAGGSRRSHRSATMTTPMAMAASSIVASFPGSSGLRRRRRHAGRR